MSSLGRLAGINTSASTVVVLAARNRLVPKPMVAMPADDHHHGHDTHMSLPNHFKPSSSFSISKQLLSGKMTATNSFNRTVSTRHAHTDIRVPDFAEYRNAYSKDPAQSSKETSDDKQTYSYLTTFATGMALAYGAKTIVCDIVSSLAPGADVLAMAKIEVALSEVPEGKSVLFKWRSKPLYIRHRTQEEIANERSIDITTLRDQQTDEQRSKKAEWIVVVGLCTHLGCVPVANQGDFNGFFCPCHGSHYDSAGRIRKGPAPLNLEVPDHSFPDENTIVIG